MPPDCRIAVKVVPGASGNDIAGWLGDTLKIRVSAPPERGRANAAVVALLADALGLPMSSVTLVRGAASPRKTIEISGIDEAELRRRLAR